MTRPIVSALGAAALFGVSTPLAKGLVGDVHPIMLAGLLYAGSGLGLAALLVARRMLAPGKAVARPRRADIGWLIGAILVGGVAAPVLLMFGLARLPASSASLLLNAEAVFTALLAWFVFREHFDARIATGMASIVAGGLALSWPIEWTPASRGTLFVLGACACWALDNNLTRKVSAGDALTIACLKGVVAGAVNIGLAIALGSGLPSLARASAAAVIGFGGYGISLALFVVALRGLGAGRTGAYFSTAPFLGATFAVLATPEPMTVQLLAAGALMAIGVWLHASEHHEHTHFHAELTHEHAHVHDVHHRHSHGADWDGSEPHTHPHRHLPITHSHPHFPDIHHRHDH